MSKGKWRRLAAVAWRPHASIAASISHGAYVARITVTVKGRGHRRVLRELATTLARLPGMFEHGWTCVAEELTTPEERAGTWPPRGGGEPDSASQVAAAVVGGRWKLLPPSWRYADLVVELHRKRRGFESTVVVAMRLVCVSREQEGKLRLVNPISPFEDLVRDSSLRTTRRELAAALGDSERGDEMEIERRGRLVRDDGLVIELVLPASAMTADSPFGPPHGDTNGDARRA